MYQEALLLENRKKIGDKSLNDELANILNISYDAAHRRSSLKSKFSLEEAVELARYYQISLDQFVGTPNQLVVQRTQPVKSSEDLLNYFDNSLKILSSFKNKNHHAKVYYSAKDIPFFYTISDSVLSKFKFYVWMNLLNQDKFLTKFKDFDFKYYSESNKALEELYEQQEVTEIWNESSISSILQQIKFYFEIGMISSKEGELILEDLELLFARLESKIADNKNFEIYINELVILNNSILFTNETENAYFVPFSMFGYIMTNDKVTSDDAKSYFEHQIKNSKSLNNAGNRDRALFFNKMKRKINALKDELV